MKIRIALLLIFLVSFCTCKKKCGPDCTISCSGTANFSGVTTRDVNGVLTGSVDSTDWRTDETWCERELSFFGETDLAKFNNSGLSTAYRDSLLLANSTHCNFCPVGFTASFYPNPFPISANPHFNINISNTDYLTVVFVDSKGDVINNFSNSTNTVFHASQILNAGQIYRLYYMAKYKNSNYYFKGHGDIQVQ